MTVRGPWSNQLLSVWGSLRLTPIILTDLMYLFIQHVVVHTHNDTVDLNDFMNCISAVLYCEIELWITA